MSPPVFPARRGEEALCEPEALYSGRKIALDSPTKASRPKLRGYLQAARASLELKRIKKGLVEESDTEKQLCCSSFCPWGFERSSW